MGSPDRNDPDERNRFVRWWFPRWNYNSPWYTWLRGYIALALAASLVCAGVITLPPLIFPVSVPPPRCGEPSLTAGVYFDGSECVGVTDGSYVFSAPGASYLAGLAPVMRKIKKYNDTTTGCQSYTSTQVVKVGAMIPFGDLNAGVRAVHELEGIAAAFYESTQQPESSLYQQCTHPIQLLVAQMGSNNEQAAKADALALAAKHVVAVVGMGLSSQATANVTAVLDTHEIPMVADHVTAEGFDQNGSETDHPNYSYCGRAVSDTAGHAAYQSGLGSYFFRVTPRNAIQVQTMTRWLKGMIASQKAEQAREYYLVQPNNATDPYSVPDPSTCTLLPLITQGAQAAGITHALVTSYFAPDDSQFTVDKAAGQVCAEDGAATVFYAARAVYLSMFLDDIKKQMESGTCHPSTVTVLAQSDAAQLRTQAPIDYIESARKDVLSSDQFRSGRLKVYYTPLADPALIPGGTHGFADLTSAFHHLGFSRDDLNDGWAIMGYDAFATVATAIFHAGDTKALNGTDIETTIQDTLQASPQNVTGSQVVVPGADGNFTFNSDGNRTGSGPGLVRLCPDRPIRSANTKIVPVTNGEPGNC